LQGGHFGAEVEKSLDRSRSKFMVTPLVGLAIIASFASPLRYTGIRRGTRWLELTLKMIFTGSEFPSRFRNGLLREHKFASHRSRSYIQHGQRIKRVKRGCQRQVQVPIDTNLFKRQCTILRGPCNLDWQGLICTEYEAWSTVL
jgi:hypothetical protein